MSVLRNQNWQANQRVDLSHLRAIDSGVAGDFDVLAGKMLAGKKSVVVSGFDIIRTNAIGADAESLILTVAGSCCIHFSASESGSVFNVPDDRANEVLSPTNQRVVGSFIPNTYNFVGIDLVKEADDSTSDIVRIWESLTAQEVPALTPLARVMDYQIHISTVDFNATPAILPLFKVRTDASNHVTELIDARNLMFRLGAGGSAPSSVSPYSWPGGRNEASATFGYKSGDRAIPDMKSWCDAIMTRIWEQSGGAEYWYSPTSAINIRFCTTGPAYSTGTNFYWSGTDLAWRGLSIMFDNSTGSVNEIADQTTPVDGITDLDDGDCVFVDIVRSANKTGVNALVAQKGSLQNLGGGAIPGSRIVFAWRKGSEIFIRDQHFALGSTFIKASEIAAGNARTTIDPGGGWTITDPVFPGLDFSVFATNTASCGGVSRNIDIGSNLSAGDLIIGRGSAAGDRSVLIRTQTSPYETNIEGSSRYATNQKAALTVFQNSPVPGDKSDRIIQYVGYDSATTATRGWVEAGGAHGLVKVGLTPASPAQGQVKYFCRTNGLASPATKDQFCVMFWNGAVSVVIESSAY
jgi:hypothetical protein